MPILKSLKVRRPPTSGNAAIDSWMREVTEVVNGLPLSIFSTSDGPNSSNFTAPQGFLGIEVGSSTTRFWVKKTGSDGAGWNEVDLI